MGAIQEAIDTLNRVHAADPTVLSALIAYRVPCNLAVADDPTVQVGKIEGTEDEWQVGLLGIVNGLFGVQGEKSVGYIAAMYDDDHNLTHFAINEGKGEQLLSIPMQDWNDRIGRKVIFTYFHGEEQEGVITSVNDKNVFVRFGSKTHSEACDPERLRLLP